MSTEQLLKRSAQSFGRLWQDQKEGPGPWTSTEPVWLCFRERGCWGRPAAKVGGCQGISFAGAPESGNGAAPGPVYLGHRSAGSRHFGRGYPGVMTMEKYVKEQLPIGHERSLGYATWGIARAVTMPKAGHTEKARLVLLLLLAAIEQYRLDQNWNAAWKLTQLTAPPFSEWKTKDSNLSQLRADVAHARLVHPTRPWWPNCATKKRLPSVGREFGKKSHQNDHLEEEAGDAAPPKVPSRGRRRECTGEGALLMERHTPAVVQSFASLPLQLCAIFPQQLQAGKECFFVCGVFTMSSPV